MQQQFCKWIFVGIRLFVYPESDEQPGGIVFPGMIPFRPSRLLSVAV